MLIDISIKLDLKNPLLLGETDANLINLMKEGHMGTHIDIQNKEFDLSDCIRNGRILDATHVKNGEIEPGDLFGIEKIQKNDFIIIHTGWSEMESYGTKQYFDEHPVISMDLLSYFISKGIALLGIDAPGLKRGEQLQQEILKLQDELHKTIVFVTHDMDEALKIADRIAVLKDGEIIQYDTPEEILKNPVNDYVREFVGNDRLWQSPEFLYAKDIMRTNVTLIGLKRSSAQAIEMMKSKDTYVGYIVDTESNPKNRFMGEVSMTNLTKETSHDQKMAQLMAPDVSYVYEHTNMIEVLSIMQSQNYKRVPVLNRDHCVVGYINRSSILNVITEVMPETSYKETVPSKEEA